LHLGWNTPLAFSSSRSFNVELSTFLKPCVSCLLEVQELSQALEMKWAWNEVREVGRKEVVGRRLKFWGREGGWKIPWAGEEDVFLVHPQNSLNRLILNWCTGGCWFTPALPEWGGN
jgi:hypothetical protein